MNQSWGHIMYIHSPLQRPYFATRIQRVFPVRGPGPYFNVCHVHSVYSIFSVLSNGDLRDECHVRAHSDWSQHLVLASPRHTLTWP